MRSSTLFNPKGTNP